MCACASPYCVRVTYSYCGNHSRHFWGPPIGLVRRWRQALLSWGSGGRDARFGGKHSRAEGLAGRAVFVQLGSVGRLTRTLAFSGKGTSRDGPSTQETPQEAHHHSPSALRHLAKPRPVPVPCERLRLLRPAAVRSSVEAPSMSVRGARHSVALRAETTRAAASAQRGYGLLVLDGVLRPQSRANAPTWGRVARPRRRAARPGSSRQHYPAPAAALRALIPAVVCA